MAEYIFNTVKYFRAHSVFQGKSASCSKILNGEKTFNTVYSVYILLGVIRVICGSVVSTKVVTAYNDFDLDQVLVFCKNRATGRR